MNRPAFAAIVASDIKKRAGVIKDEKLDVAVRNDSFIRKNRDPALT